MTVHQAVSSAHWHLAHLVVVLGYRLHHQIHSYQRPPLQIFHTCSSISWSRRGILKRRRWRCWERTSSVIPARSILGCCWGEKRYKKKSYSLVFRPFLLSADLVCWQLPVLSICSNNIRLFPTVVIICYFFSLNFALRKLRPPRSSLALFFQSLLVGFCHTGRQGTKQRWLEFAAASGNVWIGVFCYGYGWITTSSCFEV